MPVEICTVLASAGLLEQRLIPDQERIGNTRSVRCPFPDPADNTLCDLFIIKLTGGYHGFMELRLHDAVKTCNDHIFRNTVSVLFETCAYTDRHRIVSADYRFGQLIAAVEKIMPFSSRTFL